MAQISVKDLIKTFTPAGKQLRQSLGWARPETNAQRAVDGVNLEVHEGETLGIVGPNGAGKSTLLQMIAGISTPTSGKISVDGMVTAIFTLGTGLKEELTGRENIFVDGELQGKSRAEIDTVIEAVIAFADLGEFIDRPLRTYSTGMKSRLAFAMITHLDPEILIIDEALSAGDAFFARRAAVKIRELCARGRIVILVSHNMETIASMCSRCLWMDKGRIVQDGEATDVTAAYLSASRHADELAAAEKMAAFTKIRNKQEGTRIRAIRVAQDKAARHVLTSSSATEFLIEVETLHPGKDFRITSRLERVDGLLVEERSFVLKECKAHRIYGQTEALYLNAGIYIWKVDLWRGSELMSERTQGFEVQVDHAPNGGRTTLVYPATISLRQVDRGLDVRT